MGTFVGRLFLTISGGADGGGSSGPVSLLERKVFIAVKSTSSIDVAYGLFFTDDSVKVRRCPKEGLRSMGAVS